MALEMNHKKTNDQEVRTLIAQLSTGTRWQRHKAVVSLGTPGNLQAVPALIEALKDQPLGGDVSWQAAEALAQIGSPVVPALLETFKDEDFENSLAYYSAVTVKVLGALGDPQAVLALMKVLKAGHTGKETARALGMIAQHYPDPALRTAVPVLRRLRNQHSVFQEALDRIETATAALKDLPLPAAAPPPDARSLPRPADVASRRSGHTGTGCFDAPAADAKRLLSWYAAEARKGNKEMEE